jgi:ABC-type transporter Mla maintaining outer membrane lipid asymmetry ATPase subunit MlaF
MSDRGDFPTREVPGGADSELVVECRNIRKSYDGRVILDGIDFQARKGEVVGIMGGSGHGKSTLLRLLIGAEHPHRG